MIQYRIYNPASPLDALAARWASDNKHLFPLGNVSVGTPEVEIVIGGREARKAADALLASALGDAELPGAQRGAGARPTGDLLVNLRRGA